MTVRAQALLASLLAAELVLGAGLAAQSGATLTLESEPGAEVLWQGLRLGTVEHDGRLVIRNVPPGDFELRLSKPGFQHRVEPVRVAELGPMVLTFPLAAAVPPSVRLSEPGPAEPVDDVAPPETLTQHEPERALETEPEPLQVEARNVDQLVEPTTSTPEPMQEAQAQDPPRPNRNSTLPFLAFGLVGALAWIFRHRLGVSPPAPGDGDSLESTQPTWDPQAPESSGASEPGELLGAIRRRERDRQEESEGQPRVIEAEFVELPQSDERSS